MTAPLIITAATLAAIAWMGWLFWTAPVGYQDSDGFHEGFEPDEHADRDNLGI